VILATLLCFPISTTHALTGALVGSGLVAVGNGVNFAALQKAFLIPLLFSPILAIVLGAAIYITSRFVRLRLGVTKEWCVCIGSEDRTIAMPQPSSALARQIVLPEYSITIAETGNCRERYAGSLVGLNAQTVMDALHFLSAGVVCFARSLNDTPKIVAIMLVLKAFDIRWGFLGVALMMLAGGVIHSRKIAETMSRKITAMNHGQGLSANAWPARFHHPCCGWRAFRRWPDDRKGQSESHDGDRPFVDYHAALRRGFERRIVLAP